MVIIYIDKETETQGHHVTCDSEGSKTQSQPYRFLFSLNY